MNKKLCLCVILILFLLWPLLSLGSESAETYEKITISGSFQNVSLLHLLKKACAQHGYKVIVPDDWSLTNVSGEFSDMSLPRLISRSVKDRNYSVLIDESERLIVFQDFGQIGLHQNDAPESENTGSLANNEIDGTNNENLNAQPVEAISPEVVVINHAEINERNRAQLEAHRKELQDPDSIDPQSGLTRGSLKRLQEEQLREDKINRASPGYIDPFSQIMAQERADSTN